MIALGNLRSCQYFLYIIKPVTPKPICALILKTTVELDVKDIKRLANVVTHIQGKWNEMLQIPQNEKLKKEKEQLQKTQTLLEDTKEHLVKEKDTLQETQVKLQHAQDKLQLEKDGLQVLLGNALGGHFIKNSVRGLAKLLDNTSEDKNKQKITEQYAGFFAEYMDKDRPNIALADEQYQLETYLIVALLVEYYETDNESVKAKILTYLNLNNDSINLDNATINFKKLNFDIKIPIDLLGYEIPRTVIQPLIENALKKAGYKAIEFEKLELRIDFEKEGTNNINIHVSNNVAANISESIKRIEGSINISEEDRFDRHSLQIIRKSLEIYNRNKEMSQQENHLTVRQLSDKRLSISMKLINCQKSKLHSDNNPQRPKGVKNKRVLLIDDNENDIALIKDVINDNRSVLDGLSVKKIKKEVTSFEEAKDVLTSKTLVADYDLIIVDLCLSKNTTDKSQWSYEIFKEINPNALGNIGIILISDKDEKTLKKIDTLMKDKFNKNYLGYSKKHKHELKINLNNFLNQYYFNFLKQEELC